MSRHDLSAAEDARRWYVYRLYDDAGRLLYIGCTFDPVGRLQQHRDPMLPRPDWQQPMRRLIASQTTEAYRSQYAAQEAEAAAIHAEQPLFNVIYSGRSKAEVVASLDRYVGTLNDYPSEHANNAEQPDTAIRRRRRRRDGDPYHASSRAAP